MAENGNNVVFLSSRNVATIEPDMMAFIACSHCRNKTYTLTEDRVADFPLVRCAACGTHIGRIGWAKESTS